MKIAIIYDTWDQCSPDDFERNEHVFSGTEKTTLGELLKWQRENTLHNKFKALQEGKDFFPMRIVKMD